MYTIQLMNSDDYKERFKAEYYQLVTIYKALKSMLTKWDEGILNFKPTCPRSTYNMQINTIANYIAVLEIRVVMKGVNL